MGLAVTLTGIALNAQSNPAAEFEVVSIKTHRLGDPTQHDPEFSPGFARFTSTGSTLRHVIAFAYGVSNTAGRLTGGPAWIGSSNASYDIEATIPKDTIARPTVPRGPQETSANGAEPPARPVPLASTSRLVEMPVYSVTLAKSGPLLPKASIEERDCPGPASPVSASVTCHKLAGGRGRGIRGFAVTLNDFFQYLEPWIDRPLVDDTGLDGCSIFKLAVGDNFTRKTRTTPTPTSPQPRILPPPISRCYPRYSRNPVSR